MTLSKAILIGFLSVGLLGCGLITPRYSILPMADRDWSKFVIPPAGTPSQMIIYHRVGNRMMTTTVSGAWDDGNPWQVRFLITKRIEQVHVVQILHEGQVIWTKRFRSPATIPAGTPKGIQKNISKE
jgi:hypothetical protein